MVTYYHCFLVKFIEIQIFLFCLHFPIGGHKLNQGEMEKSSEFIIFEKLFSALTEIVVVIVKNHNFDADIKNSIMSNVNKISDAISGSAPERKKSARIQKLKADAALKNKEKEKKSNATKPVVVTPRVSILNEGTNNPTTSGLDSNPFDLNDKIELTDSESDEDNEELVALSRSKSVFVSGFPSHTTVNAVNVHLTKKLKRNLDCIEIIKLPVKGDYSSFIIKTGRDEDLFNQMNSKSAWPSNTIVHKYTSNRKRNFFRGSKRRSADEQQ